MFPNKDSIMGIALHIIAAILIVIGISYNVFLSIPAFIIYGFFWEKTQHRYVWSVVNGKLHREKTGWFGWFTNHRIMEWLAWFVGAVVGSIAWFFINKFAIS
jgi:hypothetical protein